MAVWNICGYGLSWSSISHKEPTNAHIYYLRHFISTLSLGHVSALKEPSSGITTDTFPEQGQQNELPDAKFSLASTGFLLNFLLHLEEIGVWKVRVCHLMWILYSGLGGWVWIIGGMILTGKNWSIGDKLVPASLCLQRIPHGLARDRTRTSVTNRLSSGTGLNVCEREQDAEENVLG